MAHAHAEAGQLIDLNSFGEGATVAVVKTDRFEVIRMQLEAGKEIAPHKTTGPITVQCLSGKGVFFVGDEPRELTPGAWLHLEGGVVHAVHADDPMALLVTIVF